MVNICNLNARFRLIVVGPKSEVKQTLAKSMRSVMTPAEVLLWYRLRRNQCDGLHFRRQQVIDGFIADFYCHDKGLIVELDGRGHEDQADYDALRDRIISVRGLRIIRFRNEQIYADIASVLNEIQLVSHVTQPGFSRAWFAGQFAPYERNVHAQSIVRIHKVS